MAPEIRWLDCNLSLHLQRQERKRIGDDEKKQGRQIEYERALETVRLVGEQRGAASRAHRARIRRHRSDALQEVALVTADQQRRASAPDAGGETSDISA